MTACWKYIDKESKWAILSCSSGNVKIPYFLCLVKALLHYLPCLLKFLFHLLHLHPMTKHIIMLFEKSILSFANMKVSSSCTHSEASWSWCTRDPCFPLNSLFNIKCTTSCQVKLLTWESPKVSVWQIQQLAADQLAAAESDIYQLTWNPQKETAAVRDSWTLNSDVITVCISCRNKSVFWWGIYSIVRFVVERLWGKKMLFFGVLLML